jgi:hypothetical protein
LRATSNPERKTEPESGDLDDIECEIADLVAEHGSEHAVLQALTAGGVWLETIGAHLTLGSYGLRRPGFHWLGRLTGGCFTTFSARFPQRLKEWLETLVPSSAGGR